MNKTRSITKIVLTDVPALSLLVSCFLFVVASPAFAQSEGSRVTTGLVVYYPFTEGGGTTLGDQSGNGSPLDLDISGSVTWLTSSPGVSFNGGRIGTSSAASKIIDALLASGASSFEIWALPANLTQTGPARLLSVGGDNSRQNLVLGQNADSYQVRLLHTAKDNKARPRLITAGGVAVSAQHLVHTYDGAVERLYVDGVARPETVAAAGTYSNWDPTDLFSIGNEASAERPFVGEVYLVAVYDRPLSAAEVLQNYDAGPNGMPPVNAAPQVNAGVDRTLTLPNTLTLAGTLSDDGLPNPPGAVTSSWSQVSGPGTASFSDANLLTAEVSFDIDGTYLLRLAADDSELQSSDDLQVIVQPPAPNQAPVLDPIGDQGVDEGQSLTLPITASDSDGNALSFSDDGLPGFVALTDNGNGTATLALTPGFDDSGSYSVTIRVTDNGSPALFAEETLSITISDVNQAPQIDAISNVTVSEDDTRTITLSGSDPDGDGVDFDSPDLPGFATLNNLAGNSAEIVLAPGSADIGTYTVTVTASDDAAAPLTDTTSFVISVDAFQARVTTGLVVYYPFMEGSGTTLGDQSGNGTPLDLELSGSVTWLPSSPGVSFNGGRIGTSNAASKIIDALVASGASSFEIWALPANLTQTGPARLLSVGGDNSQQNLVLGQNADSYQVRLLHTAKDNKARPRLITAGGVAVSAQHLVHTYDGAVERLYVDGVARPETVAAAGTYSNWDPADLFSIGNEASAERPFIGEVYLVAVYDRPLSAAEVLQNYDAGPNGMPPVNAAPQVNAGVDRTLTLPNTLTLAGALSDDGLPNPPGAVTSSWSQVSGPGTASFSDASLLTSDVSFDLEGTYVLRLSADDSALQSSDELQVIVQPPAPNQAPVLDPIGNQGVDEGQSLTLPITASDSDGNALSFSDDGLPGFVALTDNGNGTATLALTPGFDDSGSYSVTIRVTDNGIPALFAEETLSITISDVNQAPQIDAISDVTVSENDTRTITLSGSDPDGDGVDFDSPDLPGFATLNNLAGNSAEIVLAPGSADIGTYTVTVTASDDAAAPLTDTTSFVISVDAFQARVTTGLVVYYPFMEGSGTTLGDQSGNGTPLDLELSGSVTWLANTPGVSFNGGRIGTSNAASKIIDALVASGASSFEIWALPANLTQTGPARLLSVGGDNSQQNLVLGQNADSYQVRLLHTAKDNKARPRLITAGGVAVSAQHLVHTYDGAVERLYVDGVARPETVAAAGTYSNWDPTDLFSIGNEASAERPFVGEVYLVAVYDRPLSAAEVLQNFDAGPNGMPPVNAAPQVNAGVDRTLTLPNTLTLAGTLSDDGLPNPPGAVTSSWSQVSGPGSASFSDASLLTSAVSFDLEGTYVLRLSADDSELQSSDDIELIVQPPAPNQAPELDAISDVTIYEDGTRTIAISGSDPDGDDVDFNSPDLPDFATLNNLAGNSAEIVLAPGSADIGSYTVTVIATDDAAAPLTDSTSFEIDVLAVVPPQLSFSDITAGADIGGPSHFGGHGAQFADVTGDGLADLYITMNFTPTDMAELFFRNLGAEMFVEEAMARGIDNFDTGSHGGIWADFDNDGDYDLFNGSFDQNRIYENEIDQNTGMGVFVDRTSAAGLPVQSLPTRGAIAFDMEGDGDLDIFAVTNFQGTNDPAGELNEVYRNDGNMTFTPVSAGALESAPAGQGAVAADYDNDGDMDIFAANRTGPVNVLRNNGTGTFSLVDPASIGLTERARDGISFADVNNDGQLDVMLGQYLFFGSGAGQFSLASSFETGTNHYMGGFADLDNDGDWDLVFPGRNYVYLNDGTGSFSQSATFSTGTIDDPRSVAFADIEQDGDVDFVYAQKRQLNLMIRNDLVASNRWLKIKLTRSSGQAGAFGARVTIFEAGGLNDTDRRIVWKEANGATGYLAQDDPELHLGVGLHQTVDVRVEFLGGSIREVLDVATNSLIQIQE